MIIIVIEKKEKVDQIITTAFTHIDESLQGLKKQNVCVIMNKCNSHDDREDALEFYNDAREMAKTKNMPDVDVDNFIVLKNEDSIVNKKLKPGTPELEKAQVGLI